MSIVSAQNVKKINKSVSKMLVGLLHHSQNWSWTSYCKYFPFWVLCFPPYSCWPSEPSGWPLDPVGWPSDPSSKHLDPSSWPFKLVWSEGQLERSKGPPAGAEGQPGGMYV